MIPSEPDLPFTPSGLDFEFGTSTVWAQLYRLRGMQVVPAYRPGEPKHGVSWKRPFLKEWIEYQEALIPDVLFNSWYGAGGQFVSRENMGMITGRASDNLFVIDLDLYKTPAAAAWWNGLMLIHNNNMDLTTVEQVTGGGGSQKIYRAPPGWTVPNKAIHNIGVDIKGQGGFVMLPPSMHESGRAYEWIDGQGPDDMPPTPAPDWLLAAVTALVAEYGETTGPNGKTPQPPPQGIYDGFGHQIDGREDRMTRMIWGAVVDWYRERYVMSREDMPAEVESLEREAEKYAIYCRDIGPKADEAEIPANRGPEAFHVKWQDAIRKWHGKVREAAFKTPPPKPEGWTKRDNNPPHEGLDPPAFGMGVTPLPTGNRLEYLDVRQIKAQPDPIWTIDELVNERALGFIFGPPSSLKTFIALDIALSTTARLASFWGRKINTHGAVIYLCREGVSSLKFRIQAWEKHRHTNADDAPFYLIRKNLNFMKREDIVALLATVEEIAAKARVPIAAVFVDTVSRVLPGAKENQQEDMSLFIEACEALQQRFGCVVVGVHHTNKNGGIRGSTVIPGAGDFLIETRREPGAMTGSIFVHKVKDGDDGYEVPFKVIKVDIPGSVVSPRTSLMVDPTEGPAQAAVAMAGKDGLPDKAVCREILGAIASAWFQGMPWSVDNSARPAVPMIMARWFLKRDAVKRLLAGWMANNVIEHADMPGKKKVKGYRKLTDI